MPKSLLPPFSSLHAFEAAARLLSIKKASAELFLTPSAVSRHIRKVEKALGKPVFERRNRRIFLTATGEKVLDGVSMGFTHIERAFDQLSVSSRPDKLVILVDPDFAALWLVPRLADFYALVPSIDIEIVAETATTSALRDPRISCAIHYAPYAFRSNYGEMLFRSRLFPVCSRRLEPGALKTPQDLMRHRLLHDRTSEEWQDYFRHCGVAYDDRAEPLVVLNTSALCLDAAARGHGIAIGDDFLAANHLAEDRLVKPFNTSILSKNAYFLFVPEGAPNQPSVKTLRKWLLQGVKRARVDA